MTSPPVRTRRIPGIVSGLMVAALAVGVLPAVPAAAASPICLDPITSTDLDVAGAYGMAIDPVDGLVYVSVDGEGRIDVLSPTTNAVVDSIPVPNASVGFIAIDHPGDTLYVSSFGGAAVYAIDISTETPIATIPVTDAQQVAINLQTNRLYAAGQTNNVRIISTVSNTAVGNLPVGGHSIGLDVDPATNRIFVGDFTNGTLDVFSGATNTLAHDWDLPGDDPTNVRYNRATGTVWVTTRDPGEATEVVPQTGALGANFTMAHAQGLAINSSLGQGYVSADNGTTLSAFSLINGDLLRNFTVGPAPLYVVARVNPVRIYVSSADDGSVAIVGDDGMGPFTDVTGANPFCQDIFWAADNQIAEGFDDGSYRPTNAVTRASMTAFLYRLEGSPVFVPPVTPTFPDVPTDHTFYKEVEWAAANDIVGGFGDDTFRPGDAVSRGSMAAFIYRFAGEPSFPVPVDPTFDDVPTSHSFFMEIEWLADSNVAGGFPDGGYHPSASVSRQSMAGFLHRFSE